MRLFWRRITLRALTFASFASFGSSLPSQTTSYSNSTSSASSGASCGGGNCGLGLPDQTIISWEPAKYTATFTHATIVTIVNTVANTTRYSTIYNSVPDNITAPETNSAGTVVTTLTVNNWPSGKTTTVLTYPTQFLDYGYAYTWSGTVELTSPSSTCATQGSATTVSFKSHPTMTPASTFIGDNKNGNGMVAIDGGCNGCCVACSTIFTELLQFQNCSSSANAPIAPLTTVSFLTDSSTSFEGAKAPGSTTSNTPVPPASQQQPSSTQGGGGIGSVIVSIVSSVVGTTPQPPATSAPQPQQQSSPPPAQNSVNPQSQQSQSSPPLLPATTATSNTPAGNAPAGSTRTAAPQSIVVGSSVISQNSATLFVVGSQTLSPGGSPVTLGTGSSATVVSLITNAASQTVVVIGGTSSSTLAPAGAPAPGTGSAATAPIVIGSSTITPNSATQFVIGSQTLTPGGSITVGSGSSTTVVALTTNSKGQTVAVVGGTSSSTLGGAASSGGIGGAIASGLTTRTGSRPAQQTANTAGSIVKEGVLWHWSTALIGFLGGVWAL